MNPRTLQFLLLFLAAGTMATPSAAADLTHNGSESFATYNGIHFLRHTGRLQGVTDKGAYDVPFEIVAPADRDDANGRVLFEPPHFVFGQGVRDLVITRDLLLGRGFAYVAVGWGANGLNVLDPAATPIVIADGVIADPGTPNPGGVLDEQIIVQFVDALRSDPFSMKLLGAGFDLYATGISQTSEALVNLFLGPDGAGLFDFSLLTIPLWEPFFPGEPPFERTTGIFVPPAGVGKVMIVPSEGDLIMSNAEQYRHALSDPDYRVYEVAGTAHTPLFGQFGIAELLPFTPNSLDWAPVMRAAFLAGDAWVQQGIEPPRSALLEDASGEDPVYGFETGIARDINGNARGGVRLPQVTSGQATYVASLIEFELLPGLPGLVGLEIDLSCVPLPDGSERFPNHGGYLSSFSDQAHRLAKAGYLLEQDVDALMEQAAQSDIGKPSSCD